MAGKVPVPDFGCKLARKADATVVVDEHHVRPASSSPIGFLIGPGTAPHTINSSRERSFPVLNLLCEQESLDFLQRPFALDRILEVLLRGGVPAGDHEEDFSGYE
jgi:hypothetical protein